MRSPGRNYGGAESRRKQVARRENPPKRTGRRNRNKTVRRVLKEERTRGGRRALSVEGLRMSREEREKGKKDTEGGEEFEK